MSAVAEFCEILSGHPDGQRHASPFPFAPPRAGAAGDFSQFEHFRFSKRLRPRLRCRTRKTKTLTVENELPARLLSASVWGMSGSVGHRLDKGSGRESRWHEFEIQSPCEARDCATPFNIFQPRPQSFPVATNQCKWIADFRFDRYAGKETDRHNPIKLTAESLRTNISRTDYCDSVRRTPFALAGPRF